LLSKITTVRQERERIASLSERLAGQQQTFKRAKVKNLLLSVGGEAAQEIQDLSWLQDNLKDGKLQDPTVRDIQQVVAEYQGTWNKLKKVWNQLAELHRRGWAIILAASAVVLLAVGVVWIASSPSVWPVLGG